jgi:F-type H+-transporting ATPase subunit b
MPQIEQLPLIFGSQFFWLALVFAIIFFVVGRGMLPKVRSTIEKREQAIAEDLEKAKAAQIDAAQIESEWRAEMDQARAEASRIANEARREAARAIESRLDEALDGIDERVEQARVRIWNSVQAARAEMEVAMADAAGEIVEQLTGITIDQQDAAKAVAAEFETLGGGGCIKRRPTADRKPQAAGSGG